MKFFLVILTFLISSCSTVPIENYSYNVPDTQKIVPVNYQIIPISTGSITTSNIRYITSEIEKSGYFSKLESSSLDNSLPKLNIRYKRLANDSFMEKLSVYFSAFTLFTIPAYERVQHWLEVTLSSDDNILFEKEYYMSTDVYLSIWNMASVRTEQGIPKMLDQMYKDIEVSNTVPKINGEY